MCCLQVLRFSEEQLSGGVLDDSCLAVIARGCTQLQELELVQVSRRQFVSLCEPSASLLAVAMCRSPCALLA